ncbi:MAG: helix-turn-helix transcriptional regulator [Eubacteriales bacterium]|nr:helix-turn-helix transcriptional regulator [Eubacteriales bacterium]
MRKTKEEPGENQRKYEEKYRKLGKNIAHYRKQARMSQLQLAEAVDISRTHMSNIEASGVTVAVSLELLYKFASVLGVNVKTLLESPNDLE